jgi:Helix-turn-helix domain
LFQHPGRAGHRQRLLAGVLGQEGAMNNASNQPHTIDPLIQRALSHPRRAAMLGHLMQKRSGGTDEAELADALDLTMPTVRYHLMVLRDADLVTHVGDRGPGTAGRYIAAASAGA